MFLSKKNTNFAETKQIINIKQINVMAKRKALAISVIVWVLLLVYYICACDSLSTAFECMFTMGLVMCSFLYICLTKW